MLVNNIYENIILKYRGIMKHKTKIGIMVPVIMVTAHAPEETHAVRWSSNIVRVLCILRHQPHRILHHWTITSPEFCNHWNREFCVRIIRNIRTSKAVSVGILVWIKPPVLPTHTLVPTIGPHV